MLWLAEVAEEELAQVVRPGASARQMVQRWEFQQFVAHQVRQGQRLVRQGQRALLAHQEAQLQAVAQQAWRERHHPVVLLQLPAGAAPSAAQTSPACPPDSEPHPSTGCPLPDPC